jgi:hypothetical protein
MRLKESKNYTKSYIQTKDLAKYVGKGLRSIGKKQRKLIQPVFTKANLSCWLIPFKTILAELYIKLKPMMFSTQRRTKTRY